MPHSYPVQISDKPSLLSNPLLYRTKLTAMLPACFKYLQKPG